MTYKGTKRIGNQDFIQSLQKIMVDKGLNRNMIAKRSMLDGSYVYRLFQGARSTPKPATLCKLARGFSISEEQMFKLAGLDKSKHGNQKAVVFFDYDQNYYIYNGKKISPNDWGIVKAMLKKIIR